MKLLGENYLLFVNQTRARQDMRELGVHHLVAGWMDGAMSSIPADICRSIDLRFTVPVGFGKERFRAVASFQASGDEMVRLLNILADSLNGATYSELTVLDGVDAALIYQAVELERDSKRGMATYRFHFADAGRKLLQSGTQNDEDSSHPH